MRKSKGGSRRKLKDNPGYLQVLEAIQIDIAVIKNELKWHRWLISTILEMLLSLVVKVFLG